MLTGLLSKSVGFAAQLLIVYHFGVGAVTDIFFWGVTLQFSSSILLGAVNAAVVVPHGIHVLDTEGARSAGRFLGGVMRAYLGLALSLLVAAILIPLDVIGGISKFDADVLSDHDALLRMMLLAAPMAVMSSFFGDALSIHRLFSISMVAEALRQVMFCACFLLLRSEVGENSLAIAYLAGLATQTLLLGWAYRQKGGAFVSQGPPLTRKFRVDACYAVLLQLLPMFFSLYVAYMLSGFQAGTFSALNYAASLIGLLQTLILAKTASVAGVYFARLHAQERLEELGSTFHYYLKPVMLGLFLLLPVAILFDREIISLAFRRGNFQGSDVIITAEFFSLLILSLPLILLDNFLTQVIFASKKIAPSAYLTVVYHIACLSLVTVMLHRFGHLGYPLGLFSARIVHTIFLWLHARRLFVFLRFGGMLLYTFRLGFSLAGGLLVAMLLAKIIGTSHNLPALAAILIAPFAWRENRAIAGHLAAVLRRKVAHA